MTAPRAVHKFQLALTDEQRVEMPQYARPLKVDIQGLNIVLWAEVTPSFPMEERVVIIKGTGHDLPDAADATSYVGSVMDRQFVWHVFMKPQE